MGYCKLSCCCLILISFFIVIEGDCIPGQFQCKSGGTCVDSKFTCNGIKECPDGSDEALDCANGCVVNGTTLAPNTTGQDMEWWYVCQNKKWVLSGCVVHGHRHNAEEIYRVFTNEGVFWGKCQQLSNGFFMRQPLGCVDAKGKNVDPGETFMINDAFWGTCLITKNMTTVPDLGQVSLNEVSWQVTGCNNGSNAPLKEGDEFPWIFDPYAILGVKVKCKLPKKAKTMPTLNPTSCIVGLNSSTSRWEVRILRDHCYMPADDLIFYCAIFPHRFGSKSGAQGQAQTQPQADTKRFALNITENSPKEIQRLTNDKYRECFEKDQALTDLANTPKPRVPLPNPQSPPGPPTNPQVPPPSPQVPPPGSPTNSQVPPSSSQTNSQFPPQPQPGVPGRKKRSLMDASMFEKTMHTKFSGMVRSVHSKMTNLDVKNLLIKPII